MDIAILVICSLNLVGLGIVVTVGLKFASVFANLGQAFGMFNSFAPKPVDTKGQKNGLPKNTV